MRIHTRTIGTLVATAATTVITACGASAPKPAPAPAAARPAASVAEASAHAWLAAMKDAKTDTLAAVVSSSTLVSYTDNGDGEPMTASCAPWHKKIAPVGSDGGKLRTCLHEILVSSDQMTAQPTTLADEGDSWGDEQTAALTRLAKDHTLWSIITNVPEDARGQDDTYGAVLAIDAAGKIDFVAMEYTGHGE
jgi:hypothetical protein